jgi:hypothetical protein
MSLRRMLRRASGLLILGICMHFASALPQGGLRAQTTAKTSDGSGVSAQDKQKLAASAIKLPLFFEANEGQTDPSVLFLTRSNGYTMLLKPTETLLVGQEVHKSNGLNGTTGKADLKSPAAGIRMELLGANRAPKMSGGEELRGKVNYLIGNDPRAWHMGVPIFAQVKTEQVYPGVDLLFHGDQRQMEYDFVVAPGADATKVAFKILGAKKIEIDADGDLVLHNSSSDFKMRKPVIYQEDENGRREVRGGFVLSAKNEVRFEVGRYDHAEQLVIDPAIGYSTFLGGNGSDQPFALAVDSSTPSAPKVYVAGYTTSTTTFLDTLAPKITTLGTSGATSYGFVAKIDPTITGAPGVDTSLDYLTFVGGSTAFTGTAACESELVTVSVDTSPGASDAEAVATGLTDCSDYPGTKIQAISGAIANVATRLTASGAAIDVSVLLGGNGVAEGAFASVDGSGNVLIGTATSSTNMPVTSGAYITTLNNGGTGTYDCYIAKLPRAGFNPPSYLTYLNTGGGSSTGDTVTCGAIEDSTGKIDAGGNTVSATVFNVGAGGASLANGFQKTLQGTQDIFLMKLDPTLSGTAELVYGTYYGGGGATVATNGALDLGNGVVAVGGYTTSATTGATAPDVPLANAYQSTNLGAGTGLGETGFLVVLDTSSTGTASLLCSTYFGGSSGSDEVRAVTYDAGDPTAFRIILGGQTSSPTSFPTLNALQSFQGVQNGFVASLKVPLQGQSFPTSLYFSSPIGGGAAASSPTGSEQIVGVGVDANHTIYAAGRTSSANFFGNLTLPVPLNGFQTSCTSCGDATPLPDAVVFSILQAPGATLQSISITPTSAAIAVSGTQQFDAQGFYSDGTITDITTAVAWTSSSTGIATMSGTTPGLAIAGTTAGSTTITASLSGVSSSSVTLTVTATTDEFEMALVGTAFGTVVDNATPQQINCTNATGQGEIGSTCDTTYPNGKIVTFTETASPGSVFAGWSGAVTATQCPATSTTCTLTVNENPEELIATFNLGTGTPTLTVTPASSGATGGGTVTGSIGGTATIIDCVMNGTSTTGTCTQTLTASGALNTLTAEANSTSNFGGWTGPCVFITSLGKCVVAMSGTQQVTALFTAQGNSFTVSVTGNGTVTSASLPTATEIDCGNPAPPSVCSTTFTSGTSVSLTATPATGYSFSSWTAGPCNGTTASTCAFVVSNTTATSATALFTINTYLLTVNRAGTQGGTVTSNPVNPQSGSISCGPAAGIVDCSVIATYNTAVTLTETPPAGGGFGSWSATPTSCTVSGATCTFNMPAGPETVTATFTTGAPAGPVLTISKSHDGTFTVGESGAEYTVTVSNTGTAPTSGTATVTETVPSGLILDAMGGTDWTCEDNSCTNTDVIPAGSSYPPITVIVDVASNATSPQVNSVSVSGGGAAAAASATDSTPIQMIVADFGGDYGYADGIDDKQRIDGKTAPLQIVLTNESPTQSVTFSSVSADNAAFTVGMNCTTLAPGQSCIVTASFTAATACQNQFAKITVADNDPTGNLLLEVNGFGADTAIQVDDLTDSTLTAQALAQSLVGTGVTISNVKYTGSPRAAGKFSSATNILGFTSGIVLSTGSVRNVVGPNCVSGPDPAENDNEDTGISVDNVQPGDTDLTNLGGGPTEDASVLEFDFVPTSPSVSFQYTFSSDEYNEFVGVFNDVFAFFLTAEDGSPVNIALVTGTNLPVSINNVNDGNTTSDPPTPPTNPQFYINNEFAPASAPLDTEMNGLTTTLTAQATVTPGLTYHIKLAIADAEDHLYDSNVFVQAGSLSSANVTANPTSLTFGSQAQGTTSAFQPVVITNVGTTTVTISSIVASTNFGETNTCPATLTAGGGTGSNCTVNVNFTPSATGTLTGTVTVTYTNAGSETPQTTTTTLTGAGAAATGGTLLISPTTLRFGSQAVGTTSAPLSVTVNNTGNTVVTFTSIAMSGDFAGATLAQCPSIQVDAAPCTFSITFKPTATGTRTGAITFTDNATGSPQLVALSGTGATSSVIITVAPGGSTTATTVSGGTAYYGLMISGAPGVTGTVQLGCVPSSILITCKVIPGSLTLNGGSTEVAFAIQTFCQGTTTATGFVAPIVGGNGGGLGLLLVTMVFGGAVWTYRRNRRVALTFATLLLVALGSAACNSLPSGPNGATPAGTYTLSLTTSLNGGPPQTLNNFLTLVVK